MGMPIQICIVEEDLAKREQRAAFLNEANGFRCIGSYASAEAALAGVSHRNADVALVDMQLPGMSGIECVAELKSRLPKLEVLMLAAQEDRELIFKSLRAGASGCLLKESPHSELVQAVAQVHAGGSPMSMPIARKVVDYFHETRQPGNILENLTQREYEILKLLAQGDLYKEIGDKLKISVNTVKTHLRVIYEKLHVQSRTEATAKFLGH
jgi:DNA-binding NarL/FixJ family response regulator